METTPDQRQGPGQQDSSPSPYPPLRLWEPAPRFNTAHQGRSFSFDSLGGQRVVLSFLGALPAAQRQHLCQAVAAVAPSLLAQDCSFIAVGADADEADGADNFAQLPGGLVLADPGQAISRLYGVVQGAPGQLAWHPTSVVIDARQRVMAILPLAPVDPPAARAHVVQLLQSLQEIPLLETTQLAQAQAPVLVVPHLFEPALCRALIDYYEREGGQSSGFMRDVQGRTVLVHDEQRKRRRDRTIDDDALRQACMRRLHDRLLPEIEKAFQFKATRNERYIVACYDSQDQGLFRAHRDNTTRGTAHRRFAVSLNLNTGDYEGGQLRFPEFGRQLYQPPLGGAVVFSCSLLHEAMPVTSGRRYVFLPFLYDDAAAEVRRQHAHVVDTGSHEA